MKSLLARLAAATLLSTGAIALPTAASAEDHGSCDEASDVPVVLEFGTLDGEDRVLCAKGAAGDTGLEVLDAVGLETEETTAAMPMVCRIEGQPTPEQEKCGNALNGPGYWAFLVAKEDQDWGYASVGLQEYEVAEGDFIALKYHLMADGETVEVAAPASAETRAAAEVTHDSAYQSDLTVIEDDDTPLAAIALPIAIAAALLVAVAAFVVGGRRRG